MQSSASVWHTDKVVTCSSKAHQFWCHLLFGTKQFTSVEYKSKVFLGRSSREDPSRKRFELHSTQRLMMDCIKIVYDGLHKRSALVLQISRKFLLHSASLHSTKTKPLRDFVIFELLRSVIFMRFTSEINWKFLPYKNQALRIPVDFSSSALENTNASLMMDCINVIQNEIE